MAYSLTCADTGAACPGSFTTPSKDELVEHVVLHAQRAHPDLASNPDLSSMVQALITRV